MIQIDSEDGAVRIELPHGEAATIEGLPPGAVVERGDQRALFLEQQEAETLGKMIDYVLKKVEQGSIPATPAGQEALRRIRPRIDELFQE